MLYNNAGTEYHVCSLHNSNEHWAQIEWNVAEAEIYFFKEIIVRDPVQVDGWKKERLSVGWG